MELEEGRQLIGGKNEAASPLLPGRSPGITAAREWILWGIEGAFVSSRTWPARGAAACR